MSQSVEEKVKKALDEIRPRLQEDGGDIGLVGIADGVVKVKLQGACAGCSISQLTMQWGVERYFKSKVPEIKAVEAVQTS